MVSIHNLKSQTNKLSSRKFIKSLYYILIIVLICASIFSALAPYQTQALLSKCIYDLLSFRTQTLRFIYPAYENIETELLKNLKDTISKDKKINVREIICEMNSSPADMLSKGKGDLAIIPSVFCLKYNQLLATLAQAGEEHFVIITPKNYNITEFSQLSGKKIGFWGDTSTGLYIVERLIQFYTFSIPPELNTTKFDNIEKALSNGDIEAIAWTENIHSQQIRQFLNKSWYNIVHINLIEEFCKTTSGIYVKETSFTSEPATTAKNIFIPEFLVVSDKLSNSLVQKILNAWFSPKMIHLIYKGDFEINKAIPPPYLKTHPTAIHFFEKDKPVTKKELWTLTLSFISILLFIILTKQAFTLWRKLKNKPYIAEMEKRWSELSALKYQWDIDATNETISRQIKQLKSIYQWSIQSYKQGFISEKDTILLTTQLLQQLIEFNERYIEYNEKNMEREKVSSQEKKETPAIPDETPEVKFIPDEKDKYLKQTPEYIAIKESKKENQMLLFESNNQNEERKDE